MTKNELVKFIKSELITKVAALKNDINSLVKDSSENSKPTSGDKHEVGLEMAMGELDRLTHQLDTYKRQYSELDLMDFSAKRVIESGALVKTNRGVFLISTAFGLVETGSLSLFCLSPQSPLAKALMGKAAGEQVEINGLRHAIVQVK